MNGSSCSILPPTNLSFFQMNSRWIVSWTHLSFLFPFPSCSPCPCLSPSLPYWKELLEGAKGGGDVSPTTLPGTKADRRADFWHSSWSFFPSILQVFLALYITELLQDGELRYLEKPWWIYSSWERKAMEKAEKPKLNRPKIFSLDV